MSAVTDRIRAIGIMPVISKLTSREDCIALANALADGAIPAMEITFRMEHAEDYIHCARENTPQVLVGAGTVTTLEQAQKALDAGAQFIVAPGLSPEIVHFCLENGVDVVPGVATPSEVEQAISLGLELVKFFPAEQLGGIKTIKAICGPYRSIEFMPTGGVNLSNLSDYMAYERVAACGGTYMLGDYLEKKDWAAITALCRKSVQTMLNLKLAHVGVNVSDEKAKQTACDYASLLRMNLGHEGVGSVFVDTCIEVVKGTGRGVNGHLAFSTPCLERAVRYFRGVGISMDEASARYDQNGKLNVIYFACEIGGFAIHLVKA